jgi:hypothetical protein
MIRILLPKTIPQELLNTLPVKLRAYELRTQPEREARLVSSKVEIKVEDIVSHENLEQLQEVLENIYVKYPAEIVYNISGEKYGLFHRELGVLLRYINFPKSYADKIKIIRTERRQMRQEGDMPVTVPKRYLRDEEGYGVGRRRLRKIRSQLDEGAFGETRGEYDERLRRAVYRSVSPVAMEEALMESLGAPMMGRF